MPSSRIVRSAVKFVSNTRSNPIWRSALTILPGHQGARRVAEALPERRADGGRGLHDHRLLRVIQRRPHLRRSRRAR